MADTQQVTLIVTDPTEGTDHEFTAATEAEAIAKIDAFLAGDIADDGTAP